MFRNIIMVLLVLMSAVSCTKKDEKADIGFLGTLSGRYSDVGQDTLKGVLLAVEKSDSPEKINLIVKDDAGSPNGGLKAMSEFETENVHYIIGPNISNVATAVLPYLDGKYMFMLSPSVSTSEIAGKDDHFMRTMPHNSGKQAENIAIYLRNKLNISEIVVIYDSRNSAYANDIVSKLSDSFTSRGGKLRDIRQFNPESGISMNSLIEKDKNNPPQMYYVVASAMDSSLIVWQIKKAGYKSKILIRAWAASNEFFRFGGEAAEGVYLFDYHIDKTTKEYKEFHSDYTEKYKKEPSLFSLHGYECGVLMVQSLPHLQSGVSFYDALTSHVSSMTIFHDFSFDENGDSYMPLNFFVIEKGAMKRVGVAE